jgi:hypothetical protein
VLAIYRQRYPAIVGARLAGLNAVVGALIAGLARHA